MSGKVNWDSLDRDFFHLFSRLKIIRLFSYSLYFIYISRNGGYFAFRQRLFCTTEEILLRFNRGCLSDKRRFFFKSLENNLCLRERNLRLAVQAGKCRDRGGYCPAGTLSSWENNRKDAAEQNYYVVLLYEMSTEMTRKRGRERGFQKNCVNYLW